MSDEASSVWSPWTNVSSMEEAAEMIRRRWPTASGIQDSRFNCAFRRGDELVGEVRNPRAGVFRVRILKEGQAPPSRLTVCLILFDADGDRLPEAVKEVENAPQVGDGIYVGEKGFEILGVVPTHFDARHHFYALARQHSG
jgi:hypothetical protein